MHPHLIAASTDAAHQFAASPAAQFLFVVALIIIAWAVFGKKKPAASK